MISKLTLLDPPFPLLDLPRDVLTTVLQRCDLATQGQAARTSRTLRTAVNEVWADTTRATPRAPCFAGEACPTAADLRRVGLTEPLTTMTATRLRGALKALTPPGAPTDGRLRAWWGKALTLFEGGAPGVGLPVRLMGSNSYYIGEMDEHGRPHGFGQAFSAPLWAFKTPDELQALASMRGELAILTDQARNEWLLPADRAQDTYLGEWKNGTRHGIGVTECAGLTLVQRHYADDVPVSGENEDIARGDTLFFVEAAMATQGTELAEDSIRMVFDRSQCRPEEIFDDARWEFVKRRVMRGYPPVASAPERMVYGRLTCIVGKLFDERQRSQVMNRLAC